MSLRRPRRPTWVDAAGRVPPSKAWERAIICLRRAGVRRGRPREITVSLRVEQGSEAIAADDVVGASSRHVTLDAAAGYFGRGYAIPVSGITR